MNLKDILSKIVSSFLFKIFTIGLIAFIISQFFIQICPISGDSMYPTYKNRDITLISKFRVRANLKANDVIVIKSASSDRTIIKRIIGTPGDTVQIIHGLVYVNGEPFKEAAEFEPITDAGNASEPILLEDDEYFVLGDNRNSSIDSRFDEIGIIHAAEIYGKVL